MCVKIKNTLRFTFYSGFDYVVVLGGMVSHSYGSSHIALINFNERKRVL